MFKIVYFDYAAIILLLAILITSVVKKMTRGRPDLFFFLITGEILITAITGVVTLNLDNAGAGHLVLKYVFHSLYLFFHAITSFFYLIYLISLTDTWHKVKNHNQHEINDIFCTYAVSPRADSMQRRQLHRRSRQGDYRLLCGTRGGWLLYLL